MPIDILTSSRALRMTELVVADDPRSGQAFEAGRLGDPLSR